MGITGFGVRVSGLRDYRDYRVFWGFLGGLGVRV